MNFLAVKTECIEGLPSKDGCYVRFRLDGPLIFVWSSFEVLCILNGPVRTSTSGLRLDVKARDCQAQKITILSFQPRISRICLVVMSVLALGNE